MNKTSFVAGCIFIFIVFFLMSFPAYANKSSVTIDAPEKAAEGSVVTIKIHVAHNGNNFMHHTSWAYVKINGKEVDRWEFKSGNLPENENFSREISLSVEEPMVIEAESNCNLHGSAGKVTHKIDLQE